MTAERIMAETEAAYIAATKIVILLNPADKAKIEEMLQEKEQEELFMIEEPRCEQTRIFVVKNKGLARVIVSNELLKRREIRDEI